MHLAMMSMRPAPPGRSFKENLGIVTALWATMTNVRIQILIII